MIKIKVNKINEIDKPKIIKEFDEQKIYFRKIINIEPEYNTKISHYFLVGEVLLSEEKIYGDVDEYIIDEPIVYAIKNDYPDIKIIEEFQVCYE